MRALVFVLAAAIIAVAIGTDPITYTRLPNTDTSAVPGMFLACLQTADDACGNIPCYYYSHGLPTVVGPPCNITLLEDQCRSSGGCAGFNTDGWLKGCVSTSCGASVGYSNLVDTYVGSSVTPVPPPPPIPPLPPVPIVEDWHYPAEEVQERAEIDAHLPLVTSLVAYSNISGNVTIMDPITRSTASGSVGDVLLDVWVVRSFLVRNATVPMVVLEQDRNRWGVIGYFSTRAAPLILRKGVGLTSSINQPRYNLSEPYWPYFVNATQEPLDWLGERLRNATNGEPDFAHASSYLTPPRDYALVGVPDAHTKFSVSQDGRVKVANFSIYTPMTQGNVSSGSGYVMQVFDPRDFLPYWPETNFTDYKSSLIARFSRAVHLGAWDRTKGVGFVMSALANPQRGIDKNDLAEILIRIAYDDGSGSPVQYKYYSAEAAEDSVTALSDSGLFYGALYDYTSEWIAFHGNGMQISLGYDASEGQRLVDMAQGMLTSSMSVWVGVRPNYGDGSDYWSIDEADQGSLPLETFALDGSLLHWGHAQEAADRVEFYLNEYVRNENGTDPSDIPGNLPGPPGSIDLKSWETSCTFADGLSDYGRFIDLWVSTARALPVNSSWIPRTYPRIRLMIGYMMSLRESAVDANLPPPKTGLIYGPAEHDTCGDQEYYYSVNFWAWRGFVLFARWLQDNGGVIVDDGFAANLTETAAAFKKDLDASLAETIVYNPNNASVPYFVPPYAATGFVPFNSMIESTVSSYSNFRYWSEMLSSDFLGDDVASALADFRETHQGTLCGMTRYTDHLDDMPSDGYAYSNVALDRSTSFQTLLFGHISNYQSRGVFSSTEQLSLYGDANSGSFREYISADVVETDSDFCVPSSTLVTFMLKYAVVFEMRDTDLLWLLRPSPRRWYSGDISVTSAPTRYGVLSYNVTANGSPSTSMTVAMSLDLHGRGYIVPAAPDNTLTLVIRLRDPAGKTRVASATITPSSGVAKIVGVDGSAETVTVSVPAGESVFGFSVVAQFA